MNQTLEDPALRHPLLARVFGIDLRSLALFRFTLGAVIFCDLCQRLRDVSSLYADNGALSRAAIMDAGNLHRISFYFLNGSISFTGGLIALQAMLALMLAFGWRARFISIASFMLWGSLLNRNPLVLVGGDVLISCLLFWSMFLPLAARWSVDAALATNPRPQHNRHLSWSSAGLSLQVIAAFFFSAVHQRGEAWGMNLEEFASASAAALTVFIGGWLWEALARRAERKNPGPLKIFYDRDCGFCLKSALLLREFLVLPHAQIAPAQDTARAKTLLEANNSWVVIDTDDQAYLKWPAFIILIRRSVLLRGLWPLARAQMLVKSGNAVYDFVARHRGGFGKLSACLLPMREVRWEVSKTWQRLAAALLALVLTCNFATLHRAGESVVNFLDPVFRLLRIDQHWNLFARKQDGWMMVPATLADGAEVDLLRPDYGAPRYDKPRTEPLRWHAYRAHLSQPEHARHLPHYAEYLCREYRELALTSFDLVYVIERAGQTEQQVLLRDYSCGAGDE